MNEVRHTVLIGALAVASAIGGPLVLASLKPAGTAAASSATVQCADDSLGSTLNVIDAAQRGETIQACPDATQGPGTTMYPTLHIRSSDAQHIVIQPDAVDLTSTVDDHHTKGTGGGQHTARRLTAPDFVK